MKQSLVERDPTTVELLGIREVAIRDVGANARNSASLLRAPGPPSEAIRGSVSNVPFWPAGIPKPPSKQEVQVKKVEDGGIDFENDLIIYQPGMSRGYDFEPEAEKATVKEIEAPEPQPEVIEVEEEVEEKEINIVNLAAVLQQEQDVWCEWNKDNKRDKEEDKENGQNQLNIVQQKNKADLENVIPRDLEEHISKHKTGTVLIDLDFKSNVPVDVKEAVIEASKLLPFSVNWQTHAWAKSVDRTPTNLSDNLLVRKSLPLQDILGHPKCRIFVSRCSMEMVLISTYHGVPLICLPVTHFDTSVASYVEKHGIGVILPRKNITGRHLYNAISGVTNDLSFRGIARHLAETLRDQPETPGDRFIFAIESLERHRDHNHYSHLKKQNFFNTHYWDICMALTLAGTVFMLFASFVIWFVYTKFSSTEQIITVNNKKII